MFSQVHNFRTKLGRICQHWRVGSTGLFFQPLQMGSRAVGQLLPFHEHVAVRFRRSAVGCLGSCPGSLSISLVGLGSGWLLCPWNTVTNLDYNYNCHTDQFGHSSATSLVPQLCCKSPMASGQKSSILPGTSVSGFGTLFAKLSFIPEGLSTLDSLM